MTRRQICNAEQKALEAVTTADSITGLTFLCVRCRGLVREELFKQHDQRAQ